MKSSTEKPTRPKNFIVRTFEMISNTTHSDIVSWTNAGYSFAIYSTNLFASKILPKHFRHKNFSSFVRQLNMYNFHKQRDTGDIQVYTHPNFIQGHPEKLKDVRRKVPNKDLDSIENKYSNVCAKVVRLQQTISELERKFSQVSCYNQYLVNILVQAMEQEQKKELMLKNLFEKKTGMPFILEEYLDYSNLNLLKIQNFFNNSK